MGADRSVRPSRRRRRAARGARVRGGREKQLPAHRAPAASARACCRPFAVDATRLAEARRLCREAGCWARRRPRRSSARYYSVRDTAPQGAPTDARERFTRIEGGRGPFDRFNDRAKRVLALAQDEAIRFNHNYIGTEHLLLGLVREGEGVAARVLSNLGIELTKVRSAVEFIIGRGERQVMGDIGLTPRAKKVIELAVDEARRLGHHYIGTEHLLLGLVREGEGIAASVLQRLGVNLEKVHTQTVQVLSQSRPGEGAAGEAHGPSESA